MNMEEMNQADYEKYREERARYLHYKRMDRKRKQRKKIALCISFICVVTLAVTTYAIWHNKNQNKAVATVSGKVQSQQTDGTPIAEETKEPEPTVQPETNHFSAVYYYEAENEARYAAYQEAHPDMPIEDVVWRVNAYLDYTPYEHDVPVSGSDPLMIVNKYYKVPDNYTPKNLITSDGYQMTAETAAAYDKMKQDATAAGLSMRVTSGYRSVSYQRDLYNGYLATDSKANVDRYSARPGYSEHHTGLALDLLGEFGSLSDFINTPESAWVYENAYKYGFIVRYWTDIEDITGYKNEPWHIRYVGREIAADMKEKGIKALEEYKVKYIDHKPN